MPDDDAPISYEVLERDTPVYSADGVTVGKVEVVRADLEADIFAECALRGIPILEIPIRYDRRIGEPKLRLKEGFRIALALLKKRLRSSPGPAVRKKAFWSRWFGPPESPRRFSNDVRR